MACAGRRDEHGQINIGGTVGTPPTPSMQEVLHFVGFEHPVAISEPKNSAKDILQIKPSGGLNTGSLTN